MAKAERQSHALNEQVVALQSKLKSDEATAAERDEALAKTKVGD